MTVEALTLSGRPAVRGVLLSRVLALVSAVLRARRARRPAEQAMPGVPAGNGALDLTAMLLRN